MIKTTACMFQHFIVFWMIGNLNFFQKIYYQDWNSRKPSGAVHYKIFDATNLQ